MFSIVLYHSMFYPSCYIYISLIILVLWIISSVHLNLAGTLSSLSLHGRKSLNNLWEENKTIVFINISKGDEEE